jgi:hypothetical protein
MSLLDRILGAFRRDDPHAPPRLPSPDELVVVSKAQGEPEALMLQELLRNEGIQALVRNSGLLAPVQTVAGPGVSWEVLVLRRDLRRAQELLGE